MTIKEIIHELASFFQFFQKEIKVKKDYRAFVGNVKRLMETP